MFAQLQGVCILEKLGLQSSGLLFSGRWTKRPLVQSDIFGYNVSTEQWAVFV